MTLLTLSLSTARQFSLRGLAISSLLLLSACSSYTALPQNQQQSVLEIPNHWNMTAKLGLRSANDSASLTMRWKQEKQQYAIQLNGPLGQGNARITGNDTYIEIQQGNKPPLASNNPEQFIQQTFGWSLPINHLNYWVRGLPSPQLSNATYTYNEHETLSGLKQSGWTLAYDRYQQIDSWLLPGRIKAVKDDIRLTLIVKKWQLNPIL